MYLVDSSVWIDYFRGRDTAQTSWLDARMLGLQWQVGDLILVEVLQGCDRESEFARLRGLLATGEQIAICNPELAVKAAANYRFLRSKGITPRKTIDTLIATNCIARNVPLLFSDRDFRPFVDFLGLRDAMPAAH